jgi:hypothetical protein
MSEEVKNEENTVQPEPEVTETTEEKTDRKEKKAQKKL